MKHQHVRIGCLVATVVLVSTGAVSFTIEPANPNLDASARRVLNYLQIFEDAGIPILFRPLHEIDGGWFWWTDAETPENTAELYRMIFSTYVEERELDNLEHQRASRASGASGSALDLGHSWEEALH